MDISGMSSITRPSYKVTTGVGSFGLRGWQYWTKGLAVLERGLALLQGLALLEWGVALLHTITVR
jgi:hypothetical protein